MSRYDRVSGLTRGGWGFFRSCFALDAYEYSIKVLLRGRYFIFIVKFIYYFFFNKKQKNIHSTFLRRGKKLKILERVTHRYDCDLCGIKNTSRQSSPHREFHVVESYLSYRV